MNIIRLLRFAGLMHLSLIAAGSAMPRVVGLRAHLLDLPPFPQQLYSVIYLTAFLRGGRT